MEIVSSPVASCSRDHRKIYLQWFTYADSDGDGRITGNDAVKFFAMSNLAREDLKQVWAIADSKRQGYLGFEEFVAAMQLISLAQSGHQIRQSLLTSNINLENLNPPAMAGLDQFISKKKKSSKKARDTVRSEEERSTALLWLVLRSSRIAFFNKENNLPVSCVTSIIDGLKRLYIKKLKPVEDMYRFHDFESPPLTNSDFDAKPMVMLLGQYSTGKTTFINHLLGSSYPGAHIGPEPTTDRFVVVMSGTDQRTIPGNTVAVQADMPFSGLEAYGTSFLAKFECSQMPHPLLDQITFVDTPGVLSGEKQRTQRAYDFSGVTSWFAERADLILLLFDPHKLDISDEFMRVISSLRGNNADKIRIVLNKADQIDTQQLMRVYGALMWSLGRVFTTPEVMRVYIGSFNDKPVDEAVGPIGKELFEKEQGDLLTELKDVPKKACDRRINEFVKRARSVKTHAHIIAHLREQMPAMIGKAKVQQKLIDDLPDELMKVQKVYHLPPGDFPHMEMFRANLIGCDFDKFEKLKPKMIKMVNDMVGYDIPNLLKSFKNPYD